MAIKGLNLYSANIYMLVNLWFHSFSPPHNSHLFLPLFPLGTKSSTLNWAKEKEINLL